MQIGSVRKIVEPQQILAAVLEAKTSLSLPDLRPRQCQEQADHSANPGRIYRLKHRPRRLKRSLTISIMLDNVARCRFTDGF